MTVGGMVGDRLRLGSAEDAADLGTFVHRVTRLDPDAAIRLRGGHGRGIELWAWLPLDVLVTRRADGDLRDRAGDGGVGGGCDGDPAGTGVGHGDGDRTVRAADLLACLAASRGGAAAGGPLIDLPAQVPGGFPGALPPRTGWRRIDRVPVGEVARLVRAGAETFRTAAAIAPNANRVGAALLDHEAIVVSDGAEAVPVPLRVPQALARMGFLPASDDTAPAAVLVSVTPTWARFDAAYGVAYLRRVPGLSLFPL